MKSTKLLLAIAAIGMLTFAAHAQGFSTNALFAPVAMGAVEYIDLEGNGVSTDSYNSQDPTQSTNGLYNGYSGTNGSIASLQGGVSLGNHTIKGDLYLGPTGYYVGDGTITGTIYQDWNMHFPSVSLPKPTDTNSNVIPWTPAPGSSSSHTFTNSGYYVINDSGSITVAPGITVILDVKVTAYTPSGLTINGGTTNAGTLIVYQESGSMTLSGGIGGAINNRPKNFFYYGLPGVTSVSISGLASFAGVIYAPEADLNLVGGGINLNILGSLIAKTVRINGHYTVHFDTSLPIVAPPIISVQPTNQIVTFGSNATFTVAAVGTTPIYYQWFFNQTNSLANGTNYSSLTLTNVKLTKAGNYSVIVGGAFNSVTSSIATLTVVGKPDITVQPTNQIVLTGTPAVFNVSATGIGLLTYQWRFNGTNLPSSIMTTVAGNGMTNYSGDGGTATNAALFYPTGVALDTRSNLFIADQLNHRIRKVDINGLITTVAGNGTTNYSGDGEAATNATLYYPGDVALDSSGNLFISDVGNNCIRKVDTNGIITTVAGSGIRGYSGDGGAATNATFFYPDGIALDTNGNLFIADSINNRIRKVDTNGIITTVAGNGAYGYSGDGSVATNTSLAVPRGVAVDPNGNLFIADQSNSRVRKVNTNGIITTVAGNGTPSYSGDGGAATNASLAGPRGVAVDPNGNLFIADFSNNRIRKVDVRGTITTVAGNGTLNYSGDGDDAINAALNSPTGVAVDNSGNLFIADRVNNRIRMATRSSKLSSFAANTFSTNSAGIYSVVITNTVAMTVSSNAALTVVIPPDSQTNYVGRTATFIVQAFGPESLNFQWQKNGTNLVDGGNISGSIASVLTIASLSDADAASYGVVVSGATTSLTTPDAMLTVIDSPFISTQPLSQAVIVGSNVTFNATAYGAQPLVFQWYYNATPIGSPISDTNFSSYTVTNAQIGDSGNYNVQVTNSYDSIISSNAILSVYSSAVSVLSGIAMTTGNNIQFSVGGAPGFNYTIEASSNLIDWVSLITNTSPFTFTNLNSPNLPQQFYRSIYTP